MNSLVLHCDSLVPYDITEHVFVHANAWLIDSLATTDYYLMMEKGIFITDQKSLKIINKGDSLLIPDSLYTSKIQQHLNSILIDVNVPEFKLRILIGSETVYTFLVRIAINPYHVNPVNGKRYFNTLRDDGHRANMPQIPWHAKVFDFCEYNKSIISKSNSLSNWEKY